MTPELYAEFFARHESMDLTSVFGTFTPAPRVVRAGQYTDSGSSLPAKTSSWTLRIGPKHCYDFEPLIDELLGILRPRKAQINKAAKQYDLTLSFLMWGYIEDAAPAMGLTHQHIKEMQTYYHANVGFDLIL